MRKTEIIGAYLTRAVTPEQINANGGQPLRRAAVAVREIDIEARTVELAFSSETPVDRWFGEEVLVHDSGAIRLDRMQNGAALLMNHDWRDQIGVVESVRVDADKIGRAVVRFGRSVHADEVFRDVQDGIRRHISIGYLVHKIEVETRKGASDLVRITDWEPYEISIVAVPADPTVGVGRWLDGSRAESGAANQQKSQGDTAMKYREYRDAQGNLCRVQVGADGNDVAGTVEILERAAAPAPAAPQAPAQPDTGAETRGAERERGRVRQLNEIGTRFGADAPFLREHVERGSTVEQFNAALLERMNQSRGGQITDGTAAEIGMTDRETRNYSFLRLIRALANPTDQSLQRAAGFEFECARAAEQNAHRAPKGTLVPTDVLTRAISTSTSGSAAGDTGGYLISNTLMSQSFVEMLRNRAVLMQLGTPMGGLVGTMDVPRQTGGATGYWLGEDDEAILSAMEFGQFSLAPKTVAGMTELTRRMMMQSSLDVEALARRDLATALALAIDHAGFYGSGSAHQPLGVTKLSGINAQDFATASQPTYAEVVGMETKIAADNADVDSMAYVFSATMRGHMKTTPKFASGTDAGVIWEPGGTVNGYGAEVTNQVDGGDIMFGNWADLLIGMWGGLDITVDPFTHSARGRVRIVMMQDVDMAYRRVESFCLGRKTS